MKKLCVVMADKGYEEILCSASKYNFIELRLDSLRLNQYQLIKINSLFELIIASCITEDTNDYHYQLAQAITAKIPIIDFSYNNIYNSLDLLKLAKKNNLKILLSYHNFINMPNTDELIDIIEVMKKYSPDYVKIAVQCNTLKEAEKLFTLFEIKELENKFILIPMSSNIELNRVRVDSLRLGSPFMYCYDNRATASGQMSYNDMKLMNT